MERINAELTFIDAVTSDFGGPRTSRLLSRLSEAVDWKKLAAPIRRLPEYRPRPQGGRPTWSPEIMLKSLMLARWFNLSDPQLEEQLKDRLSFRRFVGLSLEDATPDETTFVVFRRRLREAKLDRRVFDDTLKHLEKKGLLVKEGTMVDATIIEQSKGAKREDESSTKDEEASYTQKHGRSYHGYKAHIAVDRSGLVTNYRFSTAREHDSRYFDELTRREKIAVFGDRAYDSVDRRRRLADRGLIDGIVYKRVRGQDKLYDWQTRWNDLVSRVRATVEHPFAMLKHQFGWRRCRYRGLRRNEVDLALHLCAANMKRSLSLARARAAPIP